MTATARTITRYAFVDTDRKAGRAEWVTFSPFAVVAARVWIDHYGNPSTTLRLRDGRTLYLVDDYGAMNELSHVACHSVRRRRDLFTGWL